MLDDDQGTYYNYNRSIYAFKQGYDFKLYPGGMRNRFFLYVLRGPDKHELYRIDKDEGQLSDIMLTTVDGLEEHREVGREMAAEYTAFAAKVARPDLVAPPVDMDAARGPSRLLAHEGEPRGETRFQDQYGWANDFFVDLGPDGAEWPIETTKGGRYRVNIRCHLDADLPRTLVLSSYKGKEVKALLPPAITKELPVADRVKRKEVYPRKWAEVTIEGLVIPPGSRTLGIVGPPEKGCRSKRFRSQEKFKLRLTDGCLVDS
jgi:hypothetical protein